MSDMTSVGDSDGIEQDPEESNLMKAWNKLPVRARSASDLLIFVDAYQRGRPDGMTRNDVLRELVKQLTLAAVKMDVRLAEVERRLDDRS